MRTSEFYAYGALTVVESIWWFSIFAIVGTLLGLGDHRFLGSPFFCWLLSGWLRLGYLVGTNLILVQGNLPGCLCFGRVYFAVACTWVWRDLVI
ncbi:MAG: hypothetical protein Ct9H300mP19_18410 [Dehalococcoidia bacterium]|nr:MAG: hypothetical protein Ct9H300mP19_18410 [Dehalococcoidia bacterium]